MAKAETEFPEVISFRVSPEMAERIRQSAARERRRVSDWLRLYLKDHLPETENVADKLGQR